MAGWRPRPSLPTSLRMDAVLMVAPAQHVRGVAGAARRRICAPGKPVVLCAKGLEQATGKLLGDVLAETVPQAHAGRAVGAELRRRRGARPARRPHARLRRRGAGPGAGRPRSATARLRIYWSSDLVGVELGGAVKNVLAIAAGIVDGKGLGASAHAALVTRGFAELRRFGEALGRTARDADGPVRPRRPAAHLRQSAVAQHEPGARAGPGPDAGRRCSAAGARWRRASTRPRPSRRVARGEGHRHADLLGRARYRRGQAHRRRRHRGVALAAAAGGGVWVKRSDAPTRWSYLEATCERAVEPSTPCASARGLGRRGERGADAWLSSRETRTSALHRCRAGLRARRTTRPCRPCRSFPGSPSLPAPPPCSPRPAPSERVDSAPSLSRGGRHCRRRRDRGDWAGRGLMLTLDPSCASHENSRSAASTASRFSGPRRLARLASCSAGQQLHAF